MLKILLVILLSTTTTQFVGTFGLNALTASFFGFFSFKRFKSSAERIRGHGYPVETHEVVTKDRYVLTIFRIPHSPKLNNSREKRPPVLMLHGLLSCSDCFLLNGPDNSLAYNYADAGYDVWLGNARGNIYSTKTKKKYLNRRKFWSFSWHEIGEIDLPAMIDHVLKETGEQAVHFVGHSQGCTVFFVMGSVRPEYNAKIKTAHMLAPPIFMGHSRNRLLRGLTHIFGKPGLFTNLAQNRLIWPMNKHVQRILDTACDRYPYPFRFCPLISALSFLMLPNQNESAIPTMFETHPAGISINQVIHYVQLYKSHGFHQYNWGRRRNLAKYGTKDPPSYNISRITAKLYLYAGLGDRTVMKRDVDRLPPLLPQLVQLYVVEEKTWSHWDFICARKLKAVISDKIIAISRQYDGKEANKCMNDNY